MGAVEAFDLSLYAQRDIQALLQKLGVMWID